MDMTHVFNGLKFCLSDPLTRPGIREQVTGRIEFLGGVVHDSVQDDTDLLIAKSYPLGKRTRQVCAAERKGTFIMENSFFAEMLELTMDVEFAKARMDERMAKYPGLIEGRSTQGRGRVVASANRLITNTRGNGRRHSVWEIAF